MALGIEDSRAYDKEHPNPEGRELICPRCKGGNGPSEIAKKKRLKPFKDVPCFTCWGYHFRKEAVDKQARVDRAKKGELSPKVKTMLTKMKQKKGRRATIRWAK